MTTLSKTATQFSTGISQLKGSLEAGKEAATKALGKFSGTKPDFGLVFCSSAFNYEDVLKGIRSVSGTTPIIGCSSASEFTEEAVTKDSVVCAFIASENHKFYSAIAKDLAKDPMVALENVASSFPPDSAEYPHRSAIMLIDALSGKGEDVCAASILALGPTTRSAGGAAADNLTFDNCKVFHNDRAQADSVALCLMTSKKPVAIGVRHGHLAISNPLLLTKTKDNVVYEIDGKPAFEVWKEQTRNKAETKGINVDKLQNASLEQTIKCAHRYR
jgi:hypothetical protein